MTPGQLYKYPTRSGYMLAVRCACGHNTLTGTRSPAEAARTLYRCGWRWRHGYTCEMCVRREREARLMGAPDADAASEVSHV